MANENVDNLKSAVNSLSEQTKKLDIAAFYTHGNMERAKQMVSVMYKDIYVLKGKFTSSSVYGAFIRFFNLPYCSMICAHSILSHSFDVNDLKTNLEWKEFEKDLEA